MHDSRKQIHRTKLSTLDNIFKSAHKRVKTQSSAHVHVIIGNPPYSAGQNNWNDVIKISILNLIKE